MNPFGGNSFGSSGVPFQYPGQFPQQGFGSYGSNGGFFNSGVPFPSGGNFSGTPFPPTSPPSGFPPPPIGGPFGQGFGFPSGPGGFGYQQPPYGFPIVPGQQPPYAPPFNPGQQPPFDNPNYFGSGSYGRPRSRRSSRHRSKSRRHQSSSSSDDDDYYRGRGSPFGGLPHPYANVPPFPNAPPLSPQFGSPVIPPRQSAW